MATPTAQEQVKTTTSSKMHRMEINSLLTRSMDLQHLRTKAMVSLLSSLISQIKAMAANNMEITVALSPTMEAMSSRTSNTHRKIRHLTKELAIIKARHWTKGKPTVVDMAHQAIRRSTNRVIKTTVATAAILLRKADPRSTHSSRILMHQTSLTVKHRPMASQFPVRHLTEHLQEPSRTVVSWVLWAELPLAVSPGTR